MPLELPADDACPLCDYLAGRRPYTIASRGAVTAALVTRQQRGALHLLVLPVAHRRTIVELPAEEHAALMGAVVSAARAVQRAVDPAGIAVWQNNGVPARQSVAHLHFHVAATLPEGGTDWGEVPTLSVDDTDALAELVRPHLVTE